MSEVKNNTLRCDAKTAAKQIGAAKEILASVTIGGQVVRIKMVRKNLIEHFLSLPEDTMVELTQTPKGELVF